MKDKTMFGLRTKLFIPCLMATSAVFLFYMVNAISVNAAKGDLVSTSSFSSEATKTVPPLRVTLGKADIVHLPTGVSDVLVANPSVADVQAVQSDKLYVVGLSIGDTNIIVLDANGDVVKRMDVHVTYDLQAIQSLVDGLFPKENVKIGSVHDQILLTGTVSNPEVAGKISNLVAHYVSDLQDLDGRPIDELISNLLEVRGEQQVMLQVKIVEAQRTILKELGIDTNANDPNELAVTTFFGRQPGTSFFSGSPNQISGGGGPGLSLTEDAVGTASLLLDSGLKGIGDIGVFIDALETENLLNILAEPNLTAVSGQEAGFLAGGEFPVPTGRDQFGNITITFRAFGVSLNFRPVVLSDDRINLQLNTEVSSLDQSNAIVLADVVVPGLDIRRADTTVEMPSGGSLMIAGLLQSSSTDGFSGLPGIRKTPVLGDLISSDSFQRDETELVVIVTAYLVEPYGRKDVADKIPEKKETELARIFKANIRRMFDLSDDEIFAQVGDYGYIVD